MAFVYGYSVWLPIIKIDIVVKWVSSFKFGFSFKIFEGSSLKIPDNLSLFATTFIVIFVFAPLLYAVIKQAILLSKLNDRSNKIDEILDINADYSYWVKIFIANFNQLHDFWAQKIYLKKILNRVERCSNISNELKVLFLDGLATKTIDSQLKDSVYQQLELHENNLRREI